MDERTGERDDHRDDYPDEYRDALLELHRLSGAFEKLPTGPGLRRPPSTEALHAVAVADEKDVSVGARLHVLYNLAKAGLPGGDKAKDEYHLLADSIVQGSGVDADQLLDDVKQSTHQGGVTFAETASGKALPHRHVAFIGQDVCNTRAVEVDGLRAAWIFSEFETDAPMDQVAGWIDPRSWPERGPMLFKGMELVGTAEPVKIDTLGKDHWHGVFREEVQLVKRVTTLLHCDHWRSATAAGMTYSLDLSLDGEIDVDRGFLSVEDLGKVRRVRALKIVGFTEDVWDDVAQMVCPFWTDWVRGAVEGGTSSRPAPTSDEPAGGQSRPSAADALDDWIRFFGESARTYLDLFADTSNRAVAGRSTGADWLADGNRYWSQLAKDWARAWTSGLEALEELAREGLDAGLTPPGTDRSTARGLASAATAVATGSAADTSRPSGGEGTTVPVPGLAADSPVTCSALVSIESGGAQISDVSVTVEPLGGGRFGARVSTGDTTSPAGLYVGTLKTPDGKELAPVQLYLARAGEAEPV